MDHARSDTPRRTRIAAGPSMLPALLALAVSASGCAMFEPVPEAVVFENPVLVPTMNHDFMWDQLVDVVDDYFEIDREQRVRLEDGILTVGRIDTFPTVGATLLEPFRGDSANPYERLESTLQSIRRRAVVQVIPEEAGFRVDVAVYKELEDVPRPEYATAPAATLRHDTSQLHTRQPVSDQPVNLGWIPQGRDLALEQKIIRQLLARSGGLPPAGMRFSRAEGVQPERR
ncbi:MAG: hypothetical protein WD847_01635 [Pirellulales bacterium]